MVVSQTKMVKEIVRDDLLQGHPAASGIRFGPIVVVDGVDDFGDGDGQPYLRILIVYDGDHKRLNYRWLAGLITRVSSRLTDVGIDEFPNPSFVEKSEWQHMSSELQRLYPGVSTEPSQSDPRLSDTAADWATGTVE